jgi:hypothetical protein
MSLPENEISSLRDLKRHQFEFHPPQNNSVRERAATLPDFCSLSGTYGLTRVAAGPGRPPGGADYMDAGEELWHSLNAFVPLGWHWLVPRTSRPR